MVSCVRDVEIDLEDLPDRIVLNASVCPGKEVCAHLSKTWFIMDSVPDFELSDAKSVSMSMMSFKVLCAMMTCRKILYIHGGNMFCPVVS